MKTTFAKTIYASLTVMLLLSVIHIGCGSRHLDQNQQNILKQHQKTVTSEKPRETSIFTVIEIEDVYYPIVVGSLRLPFQVGPNSNVVLSGKHAYVMTESHLHIIDITNPQHPAYMTSIEFHEEIGKALVSGDYVFVTGRENVHLVNISNPKHPVLESTVNLPYQNAIKDIDVHESHLYIIGTNDRLYIFSIVRGVSRLVKVVEMSPRLWLLSLKGIGPEVIQIPIPTANRFRGLTSLQQPLLDQHVFLQLSKRQEIVRYSHNSLGLGSLKSPTKTESDIRIFSVNSFDDNQNGVWTLSFHLDDIDERKKVGPLTDFQISGDLLYVSTAKGFFSIFKIVATPPKLTHNKYLSTTTLAECRPLSIAIGKIHAYVLCDTRDTR